MHQRRCPRCKKRRRFAESKHTKPGKRWMICNDQLVCFVCGEALARAGEIVKSVGEK